MYQINPCSAEYFWVHLVFLLTHWGRENCDRKRQTTISFQFSEMRKTTISPKIVPWLLLYVKSALVQEMDLRQLGAKPFLEPMMTKTLTPICGSRGQWVKLLRQCLYYRLLLLVSIFYCLKLSHMKTRRVCVKTKMCVLIVYVHLGNTGLQIWLSLIMTDFHKVDPIFKIPGTNNASFTLFSQKRW